MVHRLATAARQGAWREEEVAAHLGRRFESIVAFDCLAHNRMVDGQGMVHHVRWQQLPQPRRVLRRRRQRPANLGPSVQACAHNTWVAVLAGAHARRALLAQGWAASPSSADGAPVCTHHPRASKRHPVLWRRRPPFHRRLPLDESANRACRPAWAWNTGTALWSARPT